MKGSSDKPNIDLEPDKQGDSSKETWKKCPMKVIQTTTRALLSESVSEYCMLFFLLINTLFRKIRDTKGTFHEKMGSIKDRNGMNLTEAEDIKKRWQEYTEELY